MYDHNPFRIAKPIVNNFVLENNEQIQLFNRYSYLIEQSNIRDLTEEELVEFQKLMNRLKGAAGGAAIAGALAGGACGLSGCGSSGQEKQTAHSRAGVEGESDSDMELVMPGGVESSTQSKSNNTDTGKNTTSTTTQTWSVKDASGGANERGDMSARLAAAAKANENKPDWVKKAEKQLQDKEDEISQRQAHAKSGKPHPGSSGSSPVGDEP